MSLVEVKRIDLAEIARLSFGSTPQVFPTPTQKEYGLTHDEQVRIKNEEGQPLAQVPYYITNDSGEVFKGWTDEHGCCERVYTQSAETLHIFIGINALEKW